MSCLFIGNKAASEKRTLSQNGLLSPRKSKDYLLIHFLSSSDSMLINCVFFFLRWSKKWDIGYISFLFKYEMNLITVGDFFPLLCVSLLFFEIFLKAVKQWKTMETIGGKNYMFESDSYPHSFNKSIDFWTKNKMEKRLAQQLFLSNSAVSQTAHIDKKKTLPLNQDLCRSLRLCLDLGKCFFL